MVIIDYYNQLDQKGKGRFIKDVIEITGIAYSTFFQKMKNNAFKKLEEEAIMNYIQKCKDNDRED
ncbi:MAG: hypothetical protein J5523_01495 [Muribaculaceae bacterium]|nr:hypothetical protein [Muribaculaceae bacterium]